ncbi:MAG: hypothetical protein RMY34_12925 [Aulosira sp. DedQUE10]|nr:hypothetical protein [Aulosira sp. DedQUE10]
MPNNIPHNAYTNEPQQHPNLILGSLQLLFWLFLRPAAWRNHLERIEPALETDTSLISLMRQGRWRNFGLWRLLNSGILHFTYSGKHTTRFCAIGIE